MRIHDLSQLVSSALRVPAQSELLAVLTSKKVTARMKMRPAARATKTGPALPVILSVVLSNDLNALKTTREQRWNAFGLASAAAELRGDSGRMGQRGENTRFSSRRPSSSYHRVSASATSRTGRRCPWPRGSRVVCTPHVVTDPPTRATRHLPAFRPFSRPSATGSNQTIRTRQFASLLLTTILLHPRHSADPLPAPSSRQPPLPPISRASMAPPTTPLAPSGFRPIVLTPAGLALQPRYDSGQWTPGQLPSILPPPRTSC